MKGWIQVTHRAVVVDLASLDPDASSVASYLGLIPGEKTTGFRTRRCRLTRAGAPQVRWARAIDVGQCARRPTMCRFARFVARGLSQTQLATLVGAAHKAVVYQWEARKRTPSPVFWQRLAALHR